MAERYDTSIRDDLERNTPFSDSSLLNYTLARALQADEQERARYAREPRRAYDEYRSTFEATAGEVSAITEKVSATVDESLVAVSALVKTLLPAKRPRLTQ